MINFYNFYRQYFYQEKPTVINDLRVGGFYRLYTYRYVDTNKTEVYNHSNTPLLLVIGKSTRKKLIYAIKLNTLPLNNFMRFYDNVQNQAYTRALITEIEAGNNILQDLDYSNDNKAILIDKTGRGFYNKIVKQSKDMKKYDAYRTYKIKNMLNVKELYLDLNKLKAKLGFKKFNPNEENN
jgi:uncharacterized protein (UPF0335 family)